MIELNYIDFNLYVSHIGQTIMVSRWSGDQTAALTIGGNGLAKEGEHPENRAPVLTGQIYFLQQGQSLMNLQRLPAKNHKILICNN